MFWSIDENLYNADQLLEEAQTHIDRAIERKAPAEDLELLQNAFKHLSVAIHLHNLIILISIVAD